MAIPDYLETAPIARLIATDAYSAGEKKTLSVF